MRTVQTPAKTYVGVPQPYGHEECFQGLVSTMALRPFDFMARPAQANAQPDTHLQKENSTSAARCFC